MSQGNTDFLDNCHFSHWRLCAIVPASIKMIKIYILDDRRRSSKDPLDEITVALTDDEIEESKKSKTVKSCHDI